MSFKKPRSDAKLRSLPEAAHADLVRLLAVEGMAYKDVIKWLKETHDVSTSAGALSEFWRTDVIAWKLARARDIANSLKKDLTDARPQLDEATLGLVSQRAFDLISDQNASADDIASLLKALNDAHRVAMKREEISLSGRRVKLLEEKAEADRRLVERAANEAKSGGGITAATLEEMERRAKIL